MEAGTAISLLQDDILWRIFTYIGHDRTHRSDTDTKRHPLTIIRNVTHVSRAWRNLLIGSTSIWAGMIDMNVMGTFSEHWRTEIMRRTGESPLRVYGRVVGHHKPTREFFVSIMVHLWPRVQELDVDILNSNIFDEGTWDAFWDIPPKQLSCFRVSFTDISGSLPYSDHKSILFADCAPALQIFQSYQLGFKPQATWISQLRSLTISSPLDVVFVLDILSQTTHLEEVSLMGDLLSVDQYTFSLKEVRLRLQKLDIQNTFQTCATYLHHIILTHSRQCELNIRAINGFRFPIEVEDINLFIPTFIDYAQRLLSSKAVHHLRLGTGSNYFIFHVECMDDFNVKLQSEVKVLYGNSFPPIIHSLLLNSVSTCDLSKVKTFKLSMVSSALSRDIDYDGVNFHALVYALCSVDTLFASEWAIKLLNDSALNIKHVFPMMKTLKFEHYSSLLSRTFPETIVSFFSRRQGAGIPVSVFDISDHASIFHYNWGFLDQIPGLKVIWDVDGVYHEYVCGSGSPERLVECGNRR